MKIFIYEGFVPVMIVISMIEELKSMNFEENLKKNIDDSV